MHSIYLLFLVFLFASASFANETTLLLESGGKLPIGGICQQEDKMCELGGRDLRLSLFRSFAKENRYSLGVGLGQKMDSFELTKSNPSITGPGDFHSYYTYLSVRGAYSFFKVERHLIDVSIMPGVGHYSFKQDHHSAMFTGYRFSVGLGIMYRYSFELFSKKRAVLAVGYDYKKVWQHSFTYQGKVFDPEKYNHQAFFNLGVGLAF